MGQIPDENDLLLKTEGLNGEAMLALLLTRTMHVSLSYSSAPVQRTLGMAVGGGTNRTTCAGFI